MNATNGNFTHYNDCQIENPSLCTIERRALLPHRIGAWARALEANFNDPFRFEFCSSLGGIKFYPLNWDLKERSVWHE